ncbi:hypothetical protein PSPO01_00674 [Paraphaeosphaeria sporulosa]
MSMNSIRRTPVSSNGSRLSKKTETAQQRPHLYKWSGQQNTMPRRQTKRHAFMALLKARGIKLCAMISAASYPQSRALEVSRSPDWLLDERIWPCARSSPVPQLSDTEFTISTAAIRCVASHLGSDCVGRWVGAATTRGTVWWRRFFRSGTRLLDHARLCLQPRHRQAVMTVSMFCHTRSLENKALCLCLSRRLRGDK